MNFEHVKVYVKRSDQHANLPTKGTSGAVGWDVYTSRPARLFQFEPVQLETHIAIEPPPGVHCDLRIRSGLAKRGIILCQGVGTIDNDYRGLIEFTLMNLNKRSYKIEAGERVGQLILFREIPAVMIDTMGGELSSTARGACGFGSTGK